MSVRNLDKIFKPSRVAVVGASDVPGKVGYILLRNLISHGYEGVVYPVNPRREAVQGITAYASLDRLPHVPDLAIICTPAPTAPDLIEQCGQLGIEGVVIISAGFREIGADGLQLEQAIATIRGRYPNMRIIGPNCLGVIVPGMKLNASFGSGMPEPGRVALVSQSGALCTAILDWALAERVGFSHFVSLGNLLDVGIDDLLDYLAADEQTESVILYVESITRGRDFISAARAFSRYKPIVAYKSGRFQESAKAASSHTGALAGVDAVYEAAFQRAGIVRVFDVSDMFGCAELLARSRLPRGPRLGIVTNAGGPGVMACDTLLDAGGIIARMSDKTLARLNGLLPPFWSHGNPVDVLGDAPPERYAAAIEAVLDDTEVDAVLVILTPQAMTDPTATADAVIAAARQTEKPVLAAWMGRNQVRHGMQKMAAGGVPGYPTPERAVRAFMHLVTYAQRRELLLETPRAVPLNFSLDRATLRRRFEEIAGCAGDSPLSEGDAKQLFELYGIPTTRPVAAATAAEAVEVARQMGYPVVLKIDSPQITHKTDVRGVVLNLANDDDVREAFERIVAAATTLRPDAEILGVTVQRMVTAVNGVELIVGMKRDPVFGPVILVGQGGVTAEMFRDRSLELPPLNERLARRMLESLRTWPLLKGYRGRPRVDIDRLVEMLMRFSYLVAELPEIREIDINPLLVTPELAVALDARIFVDKLTTDEPARPYAHLAICPYPEQYTRRTTLDDGTVVRLRPVRPEDEPLWIVMLESCSAETLQQRFGHVLAEVTHEMAARYCYVDYDREIGLVAEIDRQGEPVMVGIGRLAADADRHEAEFGVLVADGWQGRGIGSALTAACLDICRQWGVAQIIAFVAPNNERMLRLFRRYDFTLQDDPQRQTLVASRRVDGTT